MCIKETYQNIKYKVNIPLIRILRFICWMGEQSEFVSNFTCDNQVQPGMHENDELALKQVTTAQNKLESHILYPYKL